MNKYTYVSVTGEKTEVEVNDEMFEILKSEDRAEHANDVKETRRHYHIEALDYEGSEISEKDIVTGNTGPEIWRRTIIERLPEALDELDERSRFIVRKIFYERKTQNEVAEELGITQPAVSKQLERAKKFLRNFLS